MFALIDVRPTGLDGEGFAWGLLDHGGVSLLPGSGFVELALSSRMPPRNAPEAALGTLREALIADRIRALRP